MSKYALIAMVFFGIGEVIGSYFIGTLIDRYSTKMASFVLIVIDVVMIVTTIISIYRLKYDVWTFIMTFLWGM